MVAILVLALALRLWAVGWGLPALLDPDEGVFVLTAFKLLQQHTLDPGWFGHPGTITIYLLASLELIIVGSGLATGRWADVHQFGQAFYTDPSIVFLPGRLLMVGFGVVCVWQTWRLARELFGNKVGLIAAALLAVSPLHVQYSQIIRTDVMATVFLLICARFAVRASRTGALRWFVLAGVMVGLAAATKWPAATSAFAIGGAAWYRIGLAPDQRGRAVRYACFGAIAAVLTLVIVSPYLLLDHSTALRNVRGEAAPFHLGGTGRGPLYNLGWYLIVPLPKALGWLSTGFAVTGAVTVWLRFRVARAVLFPILAAFLVALATQALIWPRWILPMLPFVALLAAVGLVRTSRWIGQRWGGPASRGFLMLAILITVTPLLIADQAGARERAGETRHRASAWARTHIAPGSTVLVEHLAIDLLPQHWGFLAPAGDAGCVDARHYLNGTIPVATIARWRGNRSIVDFGTINPATMASCRTDYAIFSDYDRYLAEAGRFGPEIANYERFVRGATLVARFAPAPGQSGGPIVRIYHFTPTAAAR